MNVSGVGAPTPVPPTVPVGPAPSPTDRAPTEAAKAATPEGKVTAETGKAETGKAETGKAEAGKAEAGKAEEETTKLPPLKGLTLNEVRVLLGALPASEATKLAAKQHNQPGVFDVYA